MADVVTHCEHCSTRFEAPEATAGGMANCISCGRATAVPGGADMEWTVLCAVALAVGATVVAFAFNRGGTPAAMTAFGVCGVIGLVGYLSS